MSAGACFLEFEVTASARPVDGPPGVPTKPSRRAGTRARWRASCTQGWVDAGYFTADPASDKPGYSIVLPPPNVTGSLHMGHALDHTLMDALTRRKRMQGYEVLWLPGMDHAGIATQTVVEKQLAVDGKTKEDFGRELFIDKVWDWKRESGGTIGGQMRRLGDGVDWSRDRFTMDDGPVPRRPHHLQAAVRRRADLPGRAAGQLVAGAADRDLRPRGQVRGRRGRAGVVPVRLDGRRRAPHRGRHHPCRDDARRHRGRRAPRRRALPRTWSARRCRTRSWTATSSIVADEHVDPEFGTGAVKVTPAHDPNDFEIGLRHNLPMPTIMDTQGPDRRHRNAVRRHGPVRRAASRCARRWPSRAASSRRSGPTCTASGTPSAAASRSSRGCRLQWWVKVESLAKAAGDAVRNGDTVIHPASLEPRWFGWVDNMHDWCISRQLWWGHRIPIWHGPDGEKVCVGPDETPPEGWEQDPDVLDTWFSSALWPFSTMGWPEHTRAREVLSDKRSGHRLRHPVLLGGADDDVRHLRRRRRRDHRATGRAARRCRSRTCSCTA